MAITMVLAAAGCKTGGDGPMSSLSDNGFDAFLDPTSDEDHAPADHPEIAQVSSQQPATLPVRTLADDEDLLQIVAEAPGTVLIDFYADWCGPCRKQSQVLHDLEDYASSVNAQIIKVNVDEHRRLARKYKVSSLPMLVALQDGEVRDTKIGLTSRDEIEAMLR